MKITATKLKNLNACSEAIIEFEKHYHKGVELKTLIRRMVREKYKLEWASWLIVRCMKRKQYIQYAIYSAEQVIDIYEKKYPDDDRPRKAIEASKKVLKRNSKKARAAAWAAGEAAWAARAAAWAAWAARDAWDTRDARDARAAGDAAGADEREKMQIKILRYGLRLLEGK